MTEERRQTGPERHLRVLVADDEPMIVKALCRILERRGHEVVGVQDARRGREALADGEFDAALVDANMPGDGLSLLREIADGGRFEGVAFLMTGVLAEDPDLALPPSVVRVQKPFKFREVADLVEESCR